MDSASIARLLLRVAHAVAAAAWLGGGAYYTLILRPRLRQADEAARDLARQAQQEFGEWARLSTYLLIVTGILLMYDRLTDGRGTVVYVVLLVVKVAAAVGAFWLAGAFARRRMARRLASPRPKRPLVERGWMILLLGTVAFMVGVVLSSVYATGIGQR